MDYKIFGSKALTGEMATFSDIERGWGVTIDNFNRKPPMTYMNYSFNRIDKNIVELANNTINEWSANGTYAINSMVKYQGIIYKCLTNNTKLVPLGNTGAWYPLTNKNPIRLSSMVTTTKMLTTPLKYSSNDLDLIKVGTCISWPTKDCPDGWLVRNGESIRIDGYQSLYEIIGETFKQDGDSEEEFRLPDDTDEINISNPKKSYNLPLIKY